jgi:hypothetical protein
MAAAFLRFLSSGGRLARGKGLPGISGDARSRFFRRLHCEPLEDRLLLSATSAAASFFAPTVIAQTSGAEATPTVEASAFSAQTVMLSSLENWLASAPLEFTAAAENPLCLVLPKPDGTTEQFSVVEAPVMDEALAAQYPDIKTFRGTGVDDPTASVRFDCTPLGFHAQVLSANGSYYIDPYYLNDADGPYASYYKRDVIGADSWQCETSAAELCDAELEAKLDAALGDSLPEAASPLPLASTVTLRTFRLAVAATGEYTAAVGGGTVAGGQAAVVTAVNRVTGVYETELDVRLSLVGNNSSLIYTNASTDPYTNDNGSTMLAENQTTVDSVIGNANYDIGHVFSTGGGGVAYLGVVGESGWKARGVTGMSNPTGDAFYIDYVAHEMGHQFGANHTFNTANDTSNRNASTAYEPGSGSTIMAYAGIEGDEDLQAHSDPYFHAASIEEIRDFLGTIPSVGTTTTTTNHAPTVSAGSSYTIPTGTPFVLTASGSDSDGDTVTYDWEEMDLGVATLLTDADNGSSPILRDWTPSTSPSRVVTRLSDLVDNTLATGERLPSVARANFNWRVVARDNRSGGGGVATSDVTLQVVNTGAAFSVTSANSGATWAGYSTQTVTWNVAGTTANGINTANVKISLSTDGGLTYDTVLLDSTPNDGSATITVPNIATTTTARIKVEAIGNIFCDINNADITINHSAGSVALQWAGPGHALALVESSTGATTALTISEPTAGVSLLKIDLGAGQVFAPTSTTSATGLTYQNAGSPGTSQYATINISAADTITALVATLPGDSLTLGTIRDLNAGLGDITVSADTIAVGSIDTSSADGSLDLRATGNLTVSNAAAIQAGTGTIALAADVNADGTGHDGAGTLTIGAGATVTSTNTATSAVTLRGSDLEIATGTSAAQLSAAGGVVIRSSVATRPMSLGGANTAVAGINLTDAELARIETAAAGTLTIGDSTQTGDIRFTTATVATTAGAATQVVQATAGAGLILLDDAGTGAGLDGNGGTVTFTPGTGGIVAPNAAAGTPLVTQGFTATGLTFTATLAFAPTLGTQLTLIDNTATPAASHLITGSLTNLVQDGEYTLDYLGTSYVCQVDYLGGDGNDLVLTVTDLFRYDTVGLFDPSSDMFYLRSSNSTGAANYTFGFGDPSQAWTELVGDWNGDGADTVGLFDPVNCLWYLRNSLTTGAADYTFACGAPSLTSGQGDANWVPLVGDWDGNGTDTIGFFDPVNCLWYLRNSLTTGAADYTFACGAPSLTTGHGDANWTPLVGDWNGNGSDTIGFFDPANCLWYLRDSLTTGGGDYAFACGSPALTTGNGSNNWQALVGDWDGSGTDTIGFFAPASSTFMLRNSLTTGAADVAFAFGAAGAGWRPLVGTWQTESQPRTAELDANAVDALDLAALAAQTLSAGPAADKDA